MSDVSIIGGGPAGSSAAIRLVRTGRTVTLFEKAHFPRAKLCGGYMSAEALSDLAELDVLLPLRQAGAVPIRRTVLASRQGTVAESALPSEALSVSRDVLDDALLQQALRRGVDVRFGETRFLSGDRTGITIVATGRQASESPLTPWYATSPIDYYGIQATFRGVKGITDQVELDLIDSGYVGLSRQNGDVVNVCALTTSEAIREQGPSLDAVLKSWLAENPVLRDHLVHTTRVSEWMAVGPVRLGIRQLTTPNTFYVGDAACVVDPFAGEGMSIGLYTSRLLVRALDQTQKPAEEVYADLWRQAFLPALQWNAAMRFFYSSTLLREPILHALKLFPIGLTWMAELTRHRDLELS